MLFKLRIDRVGYTESVCVYCGDSTEGFIDCPTNSLVSTAGTAATLIIAVQQSL